MNQTEIQALFNRIAPVYDRLNQELSWGLHRVWKLMTVKWVTPQKGDRALDLCCGTGDLTFLLAKQVGKTGEVIGLDFAQELLAIAHQKSQEMYPHPPITWQQGDALQLPFGDETFNCATMGYGLRNLTNIPRSLEEIYRILKPGGKAAILDFNHPENPLIQQFQQWYLAQVVVPSAIELTEDYAYIAPSLERFPTASQQIELGIKAGFNKVTHYPLAGGLMGVLVLSKFPSMEM